MTTASSGSNAAAASNSNSENDSSGRGGGDGFTEQDLVKGLTVSWSLLRLVVGGMTRVVLPAPSSYQVPGTWYLNNQYQVPMLRYVLTHNSYLTRIIRTYSRHLVHHCFFLFRKAVREPVVHGHRTPVHPCGGHWSRRQKKMPDRTFTVMSRPGKRCFPTRPVVKKYTATRTYRPVPSWKNAPGTWYIYISVLSCPFFCLPHYSYHPVPSTICTPSLSRPVPLRQLFCVLIFPSRLHVLPPTKQTKTGYHQVLLCCL